MQRDSHFRALRTIFHLCVTHGPCPGRRLLRAHPLMTDGHADMGGGPPTGGGWGLPIFLDLGAPGVGVGGPGGGGKTGKNADGH